MVRPDWTIIKLYTVAAGNGNWYSFEILYYRERQWLVDKEARESKIARKVEGADRQKKIEGSESWKSQ